MQTKSHLEQTSQAMKAVNHLLRPNAVEVASKLKYSRLGMLFRRISRFFQSTFGRSYGVPAIRSSLWMLLLIFFRLER